MEITAYTIPQYEFRTVPISMLIKADWNYKKDDAHLANKLRENILRNGQVENLIVRRVEDQYEVVNGNHRLDVLRELGQEYAVVCDLGSVSKTYAQRIAIETNETKFDNDATKLHDVFASLQNEFSQEDLMQTMPFSDVEFESLFAEKFDFDQFSTQTGYKSKEEQEATSESTEEDEYIIELTVKESTYDRFDELRSRYEQYGFTSEDEFVILINDLLTTYYNKHDEANKD